MSAIISGQGRDTPALRGAMPMDRVRIRSYRQHDQPAVARLYTQGLLHGRPSRHDTAADLDFIEMAYFSQPHDHFWVAEVDSLVVGMIGVVGDGTFAAQVRRLRVDPAWRQTPLAQSLLRTALDYCRQQNYLKVVLDTRLDPELALTLTSASGFQYARRKTIHGRDILEFYVNLYQSGESESEQKASA